MNDTQFYRALFELESHGLIEIDDEDEIVRLTPAGLNSFKVYKDVPGPSPIEILLQAIGEEVPDDSGE